MKLRRISSIMLPLGFGLVLLFVWIIFANRNSTLSWLIPHPFRIIGVMIKNPGLFLTHASVTVLETISGLAISILLGIVIALIMDAGRVFHRMLYPFIIISQTIPIIAMAPLIILWFGYGIAAKIFIVALVCFFPIAVNLCDGFRQVSVDHLRLLRSMNVSAWQIFMRLKIPSALPSFFTGVRLAVSYSVMAAVIGEWLGGEKGLGIYMTRATKSYQTAHVFAIIIIISAISLSLYGLAVLIERLFMRWHFYRLEEYIDIQD